ncbi:MAG: class I SAM-dependent methyltransferase, partial [Planctomycetia bacterium]|nr:class I SAM-dependent methyltransferase [Planctomycetia bacterium]
LVYFLQAGYNVSANDAEVGAIDSVRKLAAKLAPHLPATNFLVERVEHSAFKDGSFDIVISSAVLHFARDDRHFDAMLREMWRLLKPGGMLFCRLASNIGMENRMVSVEDGRFRLPDGSERYLVDENRLISLTRALGGRLLDPIKTTVVQDQRCMTTWVVRKSGD